MTFFGGGRGEGGGITDSAFKGRSSVADPKHYDPDHSFHFDADPEPAFHYYADLDPAPHRKDANLRLLVCRPSTAPFES
jgi:hypothetical protein